MTTFIKSLPPIAAGNYPARVRAIVGVGKRKAFHEGSPPVDNIKLIFTLPTIRAEIGGKEEQRELISNWVSAKLSARSTFGKYARAIDSKFNEHTFEPESLLGKACTITVVHKRNDKTGADYAVIEAVTPAMSGLQIDDVEKPAFYLDFDNPDEAAFKHVPKSLYKTLQGAVNYKGSKVEALVEKYQDVAEDDEELSAADLD